MKRFIFVILASLAGASTMSAVPVKAQSLTITTEDGGSYERADYRDRRSHRHERHEMRRERERRHMRHANCRTKRVEMVRHGRVIVKETRVCR